MEFTDLTVLSDEEASRGRIRTALLKPDNIGVLATYLTLRARFGKPKHNFDETKSQWCYELKAPGGIIECYDWNLDSLSVGIYEDSNNVSIAEKIGRDFVELVGSEVHKYSGDIAKAARAPSGYIFQNPYLLYYETGQELISSAEGGGLDESFCCRAALFMFISAFEGFLNLIYEMYLKSHLREDRISGRLGRENIDLKIRLAPVYCQCFSTDTIDYSSETFKRLHSIFNVRNDFIHANLTSGMKCPIVTEDGFRFIIAQPDRDKNGLPTSAIDLVPSHIASVKKAVDDAVAELIALMKPRYRREFAGVLEYAYFEVSIVEGETIVNWE